MFDFMSFPITSTNAVTIVTVNFNNSVGLEQTVKSVVCQTYPDAQYVIIDGGSTDGSVDVIRSFDTKIHHWISEPDTGVYDAMNKGIKRATGEYLLFLNSGDYFYGAESLSHLLSAASGEDIVYGDLLVEDPSSQWTKEYPLTLSFSYFLQDSLPHPATLIKRSLFKNGGYNDTMKIASDWEFFILNICKGGATYKHINQVVSVFKRDGLSSKPENADQLAREKQQSLERHFQSFLADYRDYFAVKQSYELLTNSRGHKALAWLRRYGAMGRRS